VVWVLVVREKVASSREGGKKNPSEWEASAKRKGKISDMERGGEAFLQFQSLWRRKKNPCVNL